MTDFGRTLVFGDDGSAEADTSWSWVQNHRWPQWTVEVVTARTPPPGPPDPLNAQLRPWSPPVPRLLPETSGVSRTLYLTADSDPRLVLGRRTDASLLVIGPRGRGAWKALHIGSTAEWLLHHPPAPLLVVRDPAPTERILVCTDGSHHASAVIDALVALPWLTDCAITVMSVADSSVGDPERCVEEAIAQLSPWARNVEGLVVRPDPLSLFVNVSRSIIDAITTLQPSVVALGTRGLGFVKRLQAGSTASAICRLSPANVLLVTSREADSGWADDAEGPR